MLESFSQFIAKYLPGKIQKITINAGFMCPNRDGTKGYGGCIYCNNASFTPAYALARQSIARQIEDGKAFFSRKYPEMRYLAYFQSYTSTNAPIELLVENYHQALQTDKIDGLIIGTRPDCMPDKLLDKLEEIARNHFVMIEYGAETSHDSTLQLINRCHTWQETVDTVHRTARRSIPMGLHLILGLPGESTDDMLATVDAVNELPINTLKFHQMQVVKGTQLAQGLDDGRYTIHRFTPETYIKLCVEILRRLRNDISVERFLAQAPPEMLIYPRWGLKNYQFAQMLQKAIDQSRH